MGARGEVCFTNSYEKDLFLYTHWGAETLVEDVANALLRGRDRWDDPPYLARIVFCEMLHGDTDSTSGFGIAVDPTDSGLSIDIYTEKKLVKVWQIGDDTTEYTFKEFIETYAK